MKQLKAFSQAVILIVMLVLCILVLVSVPIVTKKNTNYVGGNAGEYKSVPSVTVDKEKSCADGNVVKSIVVNGKLEFKNTQGEVIGWINEDGSNSFSVSTATQTLSKDEILQKINELKQQVEKIDSGRKSDIKDSNSGIQSVNISKGQEKVTDMNLLQYMHDANQVETNEDTEKKLQPLAEVFGK